MGGKGRGGMILLFCNGADRGGVIDVADALLLILALCAASEPVFSSSRGV